MNLKKNRVDDLKNKDETFKNLITVIQYYKYYKRSNFQRTYKKEKSDGVT